MSIITKLCCAPHSEPKSRLTFSGNVTLRPRYFIVAHITTREHWGFIPYSIEERGERDVPLIYLKTARWRTIRGSTGYFVNIPTRCYESGHVSFFHFIPSHSITCRFSHDSYCLRTAY